jgi:phosphohistidine swiveling domain-containing protein
VLSAVKAEAGKRYEHIRALEERKTAIHDETLLCAGKPENLETRRSVLERRLDSLYDDYADGRMNKQEYLDAKAAYHDELAEIEKKAALLVESEAAVSMEALIAQKDEKPMIERILAAIVVTDEISALIDHITVYSRDRIEIGFAFRDTNILEGSHCRL